MYVVSSSKHHLFPKVLKDKSFEHEWPDLVPFEVSWWKVTLKKWNRTVSSSIKSFHPGRSNAPCKPNCLINDPACSSPCFLSSDHFTNKETDNRRRWVAWADKWSKIFTTTLCENGDKAKSTGNCIASSKKWRPTDTGTPCLFISGGIVILVDALNVYPQLCLKSKWLPAICILRRLAGLKSLAKPKCWSQVENLTVWECRRET